MSFRLVPKSVTLNDNERHKAVIYVNLANVVAFGAHCVKVVDDIPKFSTTEI